ncbi:hypothetical protein BV22DRAFT_1036036 [Leucogyrophana mollusca]|uniref:Uncharacterized protein n=1 Tax=Leucogyrophana mollusca TaxID=85980 RepID=A0ACB8BDF8_9AGAM|nr:hypothetical protein BV22DRAFT_1036036 [Leucogyrophana mollusca]
MGFLAKLFRRRHHHAKDGQNQPYRPRPAFLFPTSEYAVPATVWATNIQTLPQTEITECRIRKVIHCKSRVAGSHEFLLVYIRHPAGTDAIVLADRGSDVRADSHAETSSVLSEDTLAPTAQHAIFTSRAAERDRVAVAVSHDGTTGCLTREYGANKEKDIDELHTLTFPKPSKAPSVAHFAALLSTASRHALTGCSPSQESAWFAYTALEVLQDIFGGQAKAKKGWVRVPYGGVRVGEGDMVAAVVREYTRIWEEFSRRRVKETPNPTRAGNLKEAKKVKKKEECDSFADMLRTMGS